MTTFQKHMCFSCFLFFIFFEVWTFQKAVFKPWDPFRKLDLIESLRNLALRPSGDELDASYDHFFEFKTLALRKSQLSKKHFSRFYRFYESADSIDSTSFIGAMDFMDSIDSILAPHKRPPTATLHKKAKQHYRSG